MLQTPAKMGIYKKNKGGGIIRIWNQMSRFFPEKPQKSKKQDIPFESDPWDTIQSKIESRLGITENITSSSVSSDVETDSEIGSTSSDASLESEQLSKIPFTDNEIEIILQKFNDFFEEEDEATFTNTIDLETIHLIKGMIHNSNIMNSPATFGNDLTETIMKLKNAYEGETNKDSFINFLINKHTDSKLGSEILERYLQGVFQTAPNNNTTSANNQAEVINAAINQLNPIKNLSIVTTVLNMNIEDFLKDIESGETNNYKHLKNEIEHMTTNIKNIDTLISTLENFNGNFNYTPTELIDKLIQSYFFKKMLKVAASKIKSPTLSTNELKQIAEILKWANEKVLSS